MLRGGISVVEEGPEVALNHGFWVLRVPKDWVLSTPGLEDFLNRKLSAEEIPSPDASTLGFLNLLDIQGCLTFHNADSAHMAMRDVKPLFRKLSSRWFGQYYQHPLWQKLRDASLSKNGLVAWLIQNYHLSRSAGVTAARLATSTRLNEVCRKFLQNTLEEYSHCDDFYFVRHPNLSIPDNAIWRYVPLASSLAFDQQMLRTAEEDWLGHVLSCYFQESSIMFADECMEFYETVEKNYGLPGFFDNWKAHIQLDLGYEHSGFFDSLLDTDELIPREVLVHSIQAAWFTFEFILRALDDILREETLSKNVLLRLPIVEGIVDVNVSSFLKELLPSIKQSVCIESRTAHDLFDRLVELTDSGGIIGSLQSSPPPHEDIEFLRLDIALSVFRSLSMSSDHVEIISLGKLAECAHRVSLGKSDQNLTNKEWPLSSQALALANFIRELAHRPLDFLFVILYAAHQADKLSSNSIGRPDRDAWLPFTKTTLGKVREVVFIKDLSMSDVDRIANYTLQFIELYTRWMAEASTAETKDPFKS